MFMERGSLSVTWEVNNGMQSSEKKDNDVLFSTKECALYLKKCNFVFVS